MNKPEDITTVERAPQRELGDLAEERVAVATQWQLMWWRFRKHKLAVGGTLVLIAMYAVAIFADFFAYADPQESDAQRSLIAPQEIHWFDEGGFRPYVYALKGTRDPVTFKRVYKQDTSNGARSTDFRDVYGTIIKHWLNITDQPTLDSLLPLDTVLGFSGPDYWTAANFDMGFLP